MHNAVMCTLSMYDVIGITRHLHIKLKSFSNIAQPLHKEALRGCSKKSVIMSEAFLVDVSILMLDFECTFRVGVNTPLAYKRFEHMVKIPYHVYKKTLVRRTKCTSPMQN